ncbi:MAG: amidohydrolase, partial [Acidimicrobiales bacterium]
MEHGRAGSAAEIRAALPHPVVDGDGHLIEYLPALAGYLREEGIDPAGPSIQRLLPGRFGPDVDWYGASPEDRARLRIARPPWWGAPARNTRDLATALFPSLLHERLDEFGIDASVVYPSMGL